MSDEKKPMFTHPAIGWVLSLITVSILGVITQTSRIAALEKEAEKNTSNGNREMDDLKTRLSNLERNCK